MSSSTDSEGAQEESSGILPDALLHNLVLAATILMAVAAVLTAWTAFQATKWGGVQANSFSEASATRTESTRFSTLAGQQAQVDLDTFANWLNALQADIRAGDVQTPLSLAEYVPTTDTLSGFLFERFREEFMPAVDAWLNTEPFTNVNAPGTPLDMPEYELASAQEADALKATADELAQTARDANQTSDEYVIKAVLAALVIFFAGLSSNLLRPRNRALALGLGIAVFVFALYEILRLPIEI